MYIPGRLVTIIPALRNKRLISFSFPLISRQTSSTTRIKLTSALVNTYGPSGFRALHSAVTRSFFVRQGLLIDTITGVSGAIADGVITKKCLEKGDWSGTREDEVREGPDKLWRTLVADRGVDGRNPPSLYHRACLHCLVNDTPNGHINIRELLDETRDYITRDYLKRVQAVTWNRVFLEADSQKEGAEKLFGVGPPETCLKDVICILRERLHPEGETYFEPVGEAYIYGKMDGEAMEALSDEGLREKTKVFRLM